MTDSILLVLFFLLFPVLVLWLAERRLAFVDRIGPAVICYAVGLALGNARVLAEGAAAVQDAVTTAAIPLALPLLFFSLDLGGWRRSGPRALLAFGLQALSIILVSAAGYFVFRPALGAETAEAAGMLVGVYTGGTVNLASIAAALKASPPLFVAANASDIVVSGAYLLLLMSAGKRLIRRLLPRSSAAGAMQELDAGAVDAYADSSSFRGLRSAGAAGPLAAAFALAVLIAAAGASLALLIPGQWGTIAAILAVTTLGIAASFVPAIRRIRLTFALGHYLILVFCLAVGSMADLSALASSAPAVAGYVALAIFGSLALHLALCALFRVDADTMIITSVAGICSPPFVPMVAAALRNRAVLVPGVVTGVIGWMVGTYLGIGVALVLGAAG